MKIISLIFLVFILKVCFVQSGVRKCFPIGMLITKTENLTQATTLSSALSQTESQTSTVSTSSPISTTTSTYHYSSQPTTETISSQSNTVGTTDTNLSLSESTTTSTDSSIQTTASVSGQQSTDTTTDSIPSTTADYSNFNITDWASNILELDSMLNTQQEYLLTNKTESNQTIASINSDIATIMADSNTTQDVVEVLQNLTQIIQNFTTTIDSARKKRNIPTSNKCILSTFEDIKQELALMARLSTITELNDFSASYNSAVYSSIAGNVTNLKNLILNIAETQKTIIDIKNQEIASFESAYNAITFLAPSLCGAFDLYDPINDPNAPVGKAFSAGTYLDGTEVYVGRANSTFPESLIPGRCTTSGNLQGPGVYVVSNGTEMRVTNAPMFLKDHNGLKWVSADIKNVSTIPNAIKIKGNNTSNGYLIGRYNLTNVNSTIFGNFCIFFSCTPITTDYTQIVKVHIDNNLNDVLFADTDQVEQSAANDTFEVLTCTSTQAQSMFKTFVSTARETVYGIQCASDITYTPPINYKNF